MNIVVERKIRTLDHTVSDLYIDGEYFCKVLEDVDRGLKSTDSLEHIKRVKVMHQTAIPTGKYRLALTYSDKYKAYMPLVMNVPGFKGIRIHPGNTKEDTSGCLLLGKGSITQSRKTFSEFMAILKKAITNQSVFIEIK